MALLEFSAATAGTSVVPPNLVLSSHDREQCGSQRIVPERFFRYLVECSDYAVGALSPRPRKRRTRGLSVYYQLSVEEHNHFIQESPEGLRVRRIPGRLRPKPKAATAVWSEMSINYMGKSSADFVYFWFAGWIARWKLYANSDMRWHPTLGDVCHHALKRHRSGPMVDSVLEAGKQIRNKRAVMDYAGAAISAIPW